MHLQWGYHSKCSRLVVLLIAERLMWGMFTTSSINFFIMHNITLLVLIFILDDNIMSKIKIKVFGCYLWMKHIHFLFNYLQDYYSSWLELGFENICSSFWCCNVFAAVNFKVPNCIYFDERIIIGILLLSYFYHLLIFVLLKASCVVVSNNNMVLLAIY